MSVSQLGDFGLAKSQEDDTANSSGVVGTLGYVAPEYAESGKMSDKTDVYSFGVVLLQLITGLRTTDEIDGGKSLVGWVSKDLFWYFFSKVNNMNLYILYMTGKATT